MLQNHEDILRKLISGTEKIYYVEDEGFVRYRLKEVFGLTLEEAKLKAIGKWSDYAASLLTKNSPWTPILRIGKRKLEERGAFDYIKKKWLKHREDDIVPPSNPEPVDLDQVSLLFSGFIALCILAVAFLAFEWLWYLKKGLQKA